MNDEARALRWARDVWRADPPADSEIAHGADRIARRFARPRRAWTAKTWVATGAVAAVLGALAHGAIGSRFASPPSPVRMAELPIPTAEVLHREAPPAPRPENPAPAAVDDVAERAPSVPSRASEGVERPRTRAPAAEPSWIEVSDALADSDHARAEQLLHELASRGHDTNTRAKALLGLAQLDEARKDCEAARPRALRAAAMPNVEIKTMRRALELAARCAR